MVKENKMVHTEIGLLPDDWECATIREVTIKVGSGITPRGGSNVYTTAGRPFVRSQNVGWGKLLLDDVAFITEAIHNSFSGTELLESDVLLNITGASIGRSAIVTGNIIGGNVNQHVCIIRPNKGLLSSKYLNQNILSQKCQTQIDNYQSGGNRQGLNFEQIKNIHIPLPPLPEQEAIAEALSDADAWIESLEQLIAKKCLIKQGAMQELLTPKEDWEEKTIFEVADKKRDLFNDGDWIEAIHIKEEGIRLIQTGNIGVGRFLNKNNKKYISEKSFVDLRCKEILEGDLLICRLAEPAGRVCLFPKTEDLKSVTSVDVTIYRPDINVFDRRILLYLLSTDEWFKKVLEQVGGTTHKRISRGNLGNINIKIPKSLTEQTRIATILSDMDAELEALEVQLAKARKIKQAIMQELLTGKTRLIDN